VHGPVWLPFSQAFNMETFTTSARLYRLHQSIEALAQLCEAQAQLVLLPPQQHFLPAACCSCCCRPSATSCGQSSPATASGSLDSSEVVRGLLPDMRLLLVVEQRHRVVAAFSVWAALFLCRLLGTADGKVLWQEPSTRAPTHPVNQ
jgi:hypothetical protein